jgi:Acyl-CoA dehydrogenase, N-terminal domain
VEDEAAAAVPPADGVPPTVHELAAMFGRDAAEVDATAQLPAAHLTGLAEAGLYGIFAPAAAGGLGLDHTQACPVVEELAAGCLASTFVWIQHFRLLPLGVARRCCTLIGPSPLDDQLRRARAALDAASTETMPAARAAAAELAVRAAHTLAVRRGSSAALAGDEAERLTREAAFLLVFGSRPAIKEALLAGLTTAGPG